MNDLVFKNLVEWLAKTKYVKDRICVACQYGKYIKSSFKTKNCVLISRPLKLIHMNLFGPTNKLVLEEKYMFLY